MPNNNGQLAALIDRIEKLEIEKKAIADDIKEVFAEAKAEGFDTKIMKKIISMRKKTAEEREEEAQLIATYMAALGQLADTPLGQAAIAAVEF